MILAMAANALQIFVFPLFFEDVLSPADDVLDLAVAAALVRLLGWHWELLPAFAAELVPGVDLVPVWTLVVRVLTPIGSSSQSTSLRVSL